MVVAPLVLALAALCAASPAAASVPVEGPPSLLTPYAEALAAWGQEPTGRCDSVALSEGQTPILPTQAGAREASAYAYFGTRACRIIIHPGIAACALPLLMEHEVGHLLGYEHSADPTSVMYPEAHVEAGCEEAGIEREVRDYEAWLRKVERRCRKLVAPPRRRSCTQDKRLVRSELKRRRRELTAITLPTL
jgi:hypothetical protein